MGEMGVAMAISAGFSGLFSVVTNWDSKSGIDFWKQVGIDAGIGALTVPVGGLLGAGIAKVMAPVAKLFLTPIFRMIGSIPPQVLTGSKSSAHRILIKMSRFFFRTTKTYPSVQSTPTGRFLKQFFPHFDWEMHHIIIQQAWSKVGGNYQIFADDIFANEGLRRLGNGLWNLLPIPASLNSAFRNEWLAGLFASLYYGTCVYGFSFAQEVIEDY